MSRQIKQAKIKQEIAARLKQARENAGYSSAEDFCQRNELPLPSYLSYEQGEMAFTSSKAIHYSKLLGITLRWLMLG